jgi:hypothetical protein
MPCTKRIQQLVNIAMSCGQFTRLERIPVEWNDTEIFFSVLQRLGAVIAWPLPCHPSAQSYGIMAASYPRESGKRLRERRLIGVDGRQRYHNGRCLHAAAV